jgi:hypothetical protein
MCVTHRCHQVECLGRPARARDCAEAHSASPCVETLMPPLWPRFPIDGTKHMFDSPAQGSRAIWESASSRICRSRHSTMPVPEQPIRPVLIPSLPDARGLCSGDTLRPPSDSSTNMKLPKGARRGSWGCAGRIRPLRPSGSTDRPFPERRAGHQSGRREANGANPFHGISGLPAGAMAPACRRECPKHRFC